MRGIFVNQKIGETTLGELLPSIVVIIFVLIFLLFCIRMVIDKLKVKMKKKNLINNSMAEKNATLFACLSHVNGLPIPENVSCNIYSTPNKYEIISNGLTFNLDKNKVTDVCLKTDVEIQKQYVSSIGGAVGGAVLFGTLGAMIGGRAKQINIREVHTYLIFTYESNGEIKYTGFDATNYLAKAGPFVDEFRNSGKSHTVNINL